MRIRFSFALILLIGTLIGTAYAAVTFDPLTGTGFVGKGDVQNAFGWNNAQLQANAAGVSFTYQAVENYAMVCEWFTGPVQNRTQHDVTHHKTSSVNSAVAVELRKNSQGQVTGFHLNGFGATSDNGEAIPHIGDPCPGNPGNGAVVVEVSAGSVEAGGLYVNYGGDSIFLN